MLVWLTTVVLKILIQTPEGLPAEIKSAEIGKAQLSAAGKNVLIIPDCSSACTNAAKHLFLDTYENSFPLPLICSCPVVIVVQLKLAQLDSPDEEMEEVNNQKQAAAAEQT